MSSWSRQFGIAGIQFALRSEQIPVTDGDSASYAPFADPESGSCDIDCAVTIQQGDLPSLTALPQIFDAGRSWAMYSDPSGGRLIQRKGPPDGSAESSWIATASRAFRDVVVTCSETMTRRGAEGVELLNPLRYPLDQILTNHLLASRGGVLVHGAGAAIGERGLLFAGRSGAGKTTISRQLHERHGLRMLSDDRIVVRERDGALRIFGTPWPGDGGHALNESQPLAALLFLAHGPDNELVELNTPQALERLLPVASVPWYDREAADGTLRFCERLIEGVPTYELRFRPDESVAEFIAKRFA
ncbi:MAG: hypothetical protein O2923_13990 [Verrucomicrobia bacterium]|nr:hypothetical protein [Verrucomicrobiota bacterium]MDA1087219.1 hypothetical protein [Verrucomicrobiota bacterium]